jgi:uncharacterized damage-inducible protein DinB
MSSTETDVLLALLDQAFDRRSWHGPNLSGALRGMSAEEAAWRPARGRHSAWELALHCAYWKYVVRRKLSGEKRGSFPLEGSNWWTRPSARGTKAALAREWKSDLELLALMHKTLRESVENFPAKRWSAKAGSFTYRELVTGAAAHDLYHAGQIRLLRRMREE